MKDNIRIFCIWRLQYEIKYIISDPWYIRFKKVGSKRYLFHFKVFHFWPSNWVIWLVIIIFWCITKVKRISKRWNNLSVIQPRDSYIVYLVTMVIIDDMHFKFLDEYGFMNSMILYIRGYIIYLLMYSSEWPSYHVTWYIPVSLKCGCIVKKCIASISLLIGILFDMNRDNLIELMEVPILRKTKTTCGDVSHNPIRGINSGFIEISWVF